MMFFKYIKLERAAGGYILSYDKCAVSKDSYDGYSHLGNGQEVFEDGSKAIERMDELYALSEGVADALGMAKVLSRSKKSVEKDND